MYKIITASLSVLICLNTAAQIDSLIESIGGCSTRFFEEGEKLASFEKTTIVTKAGKTMSLAKFMNSQKMTGNADHALSDLDNDGKNELVIYNFTNGAHCCEEYYVFKLNGKNKYQQVAKTFGGTVCINPQNIFLYDFYEPFGYFFTCYACAYTDTSSEGPLPVQHIRLAYRGGRMVVLPGDSELKATINDNLAILSEKPYEPLEDASSQDDGIRKEYALNLVIYYYSFGKNLAATQQLFNKYYKFPDAKKVWAEFTRVLNSIKKNNDF